MSSSLEFLSSSSSPSSGAPSPSLSSCDAGGWLHPGHILELLAHWSHSMRYAKCTRFRRHAVQFPVLPARMPLYLPYVKRQTTYARVEVVDMYRWRSTRGQGRGEMRSKHCFVRCRASRFSAENAGSHLLRASSAHPRARLLLERRLGVDVAHRTLDVPVRLESLAVLELLSLLHVVRHGERPRERKWSRRTAAAGSGSWQPRQKFRSRSNQQQIVVPSRNSSLSGARARCLPRRGRSRGAGHPLCSRPRATRARLAVPHPPASRQTRASRASRPRPRSAPPRRGGFRPRATRARSGSRASRARRVPGTGRAATTERTRVCSCAIS